jgi:hypothetical protein
MAYDKDYWNNKWPMSPVVYNGRATMRKKQIGCDVRDFIAEQDYLIEQIVLKYELRKSTINQTAQACQKWVVGFMNYETDQQNDMVEEFWSFPFEVLQMKTGDCEDGAILMATLMIAAGIPNWRVKCAAGYVTPAPNAPKGGHCYCMFLADRPESERGMEWVICDWCFFEDSKIPPETKPLARDGGFGKKYGDVWFAFNDEFSWNQTSLAVDGRVSGAQAEEVTTPGVDRLSSLLAQIEDKIKTKNTLISEIEKKLNFKIN